MSKSNAALSLSGRNVDGLSEKAILFSMLCYKRNALVFTLVSSLFVFCAAKTAPRTGADRFPTGQDSPEGAAADLARAFMTGDADWFRKVCIRPYGGGQARAEYVAYLNGVSDHLKRNLNASQDDPRQITKVFAARHLSHDGPASYGYTSFNFQDVMFVDVEVLLRNGVKHLRRTLVIQDQDSKWYVHPLPDLSPLLSYGLYEESPSVQTIP